MPTTINQSWVVLLINTDCSPNQLPNEQRINVMFNGTQNSISVSNYWHALYEDLLSLKFTVTPWKTLPPANSQEMLALSEPSDRVRLAASLFNSEVNYADYDGILVIEARRDARGNPRYDGQCTNVALPSINSSRPKLNILLGLGGLQIGLAAHELGHALGLHHTVGDKNGTVYDDRWDLMSYNNTYTFRQSFDPDEMYAVPCGINPLFLQDIGRQTGELNINVRDITNGSTYSLSTLSDRVVHSGKYRMIFIDLNAHTPNGSQYSICLRTPVGLDAGIPGPAVLIHRRQKDGSNQEHAYRLSVDPAFAHMGEKNDVRQWHKGEVFVDIINNVSIQILEDGSNGGDAIVKIRGTKALPGDLNWYVHNPRKMGTAAEWFGRDLVSRSERWDDFLHVFSAGQGVMYAITNAGDLLHRRHLAWTNGKQRWTAWDLIGRGGWNQFERVFSGGNGVIYAITDNGNLKWYHHVDWLAGGRNILGGHIVHGSEINGGGWGSNGRQRFVFSGGSGLIYAVFSSPNTPETFDLLLYRHEGYADGSTLFADYTPVNAVGHTVVGTGGWNKIYADGVFTNFKSFFADSNGSIYGVTEAGHLYWWHHNRRFCGEPISEGPVKIGNNGWQNHKFVLSGENGVIYAVVA